MLVMSFSPSGASPEEVLGVKRKADEQDFAVDSGSEEEPTGKYGDVKRAVPVACDYCRTNHLKCDGLAQCSQVPFEFF